MLDRAAEALERLPERDDLGLGTRGGGPRAAHKNARAVVAFDLEKDLAGVGQAEVVGALVLRDVEVRAFDVRMRVEGAQ